jgi:hypothetical protein
MEATIIFININELSLIKYGNSKAYSNPNILNALKAQSLQNVRQLYNITDIDLFEQYSAGNEDTYFKITIKTTS